MSNAANPAVNTALAAPPSQAPADTPAGTPETPETTAATPAADPVASGAGSTVRAGSPIPGVPAITAEPATADARNQADARNREGLTLHRKGDLDAAVSAYKRALEADPSHRYARYNLASALVSQGKGNDGLALLAEFRALGCPGCLERLRRAAQDREWQPLWNDPSFKEIVDVGAAGPMAEVVVFALASPPGNDDQDTFAVEITLEPPPGWARAPALTLQVNQGKKEIARRELASADIDKRWLTEIFDIPQKTFSVTLLANGKPYGTLRARPETMGPDAYPRPIVREPRRPRQVTRCHGAECPRFPALSPDGRYLAARDGWEAVSTGDMCNPPVVTLTSYRGIDDSDWGQSRDLDGWEPLDCADDKARLQDGFEAMMDFSSDAVVIKNAKGDIVARQEAYGADHDLCVSRKHRIVVVRINEGLGGDCEEEPGYRYVVMKY